MLRICFGFVKLNIGKKKVTYMLIREGSHFTRIRLPSPDACSTIRALQKLNIQSKLEAEN